jgi:hypothetical protein
MRRLLLRVRCLRNWADFYAVPSVGIFKRFRPLALMGRARGAIEFVVNSIALRLSRYSVNCTFRATFCTCGLPSGSYPVKFFENTRDGGNGDLKMVTTRLPKNFRRNHPPLSASKLVRSIQNIFFECRNRAINQLTTLLFVASFIPVSETVKIYLN